jgi:putative ABC transport system permease protein
MTIGRLLRIVPLRLRSLFHRGAVERELDEELRDHLETQIAEHIRHGMAPDVARQAALRAFGGIEFHKEQVRDTRGTRAIEELASDLRFALRGIRRAPGFSFTIVLTLTLGIGANTAMFTLLRGTLFKSLPNRHGEQLVYLRQSSTNSPNELFSVPEIADYRAASTTLSAIAEYSSMTLTLVGDDGVPVHVQAGIVTGNYFDVMGLVPILGRLTDRNDDGPGVPSVSVLTYEYWMSRFGGDSAVVGHTIRLNDKLSTIVGVVQRAAHYPQRTDVFVNTVTSDHHLGAAMVTSRTHRMTEVFGRLAPRATVAQAQAELARLSGTLARDHGEAYPRSQRFTVTLAPLRAVLNERATLTFWVLMAAAAFVLFIACANVANLTLMRGVRRERELHVRMALGAGGWRLRRLLLVENLTLALLGGVLGVLVAVAGLKTLIGFADQLTPRAYEIRIDGVVLAVGMATSIVAAIALSFVSRIGRGDLAPSLAGSGRRMTLARGRQRAQRTLVVAQLALCMILLTGAGLLVRTLANLESVETGVRTDRVLTLEMPLVTRPASAADQATSLATYERIRDRVAALPGVERAALGLAVPLRGSHINSEISVDGAAAAPNAPVPHAVMNNVDADYFDAAGIPLLAGRAFTSGERGAQAPVVILNASFAKQLFGNRNPIGQRVAWTGMIVKYMSISADWRTVVGVVGDTRDQGLEGDPTPTVYEPFAQGPITGGALVIKTKTDPEPFQAAVVHAIREISPRQMIERPETLERIRDETVAPRRLNAMFIALFGVLAMVIAMVGIAGVLAFSVSARIPEIGIRMSLGADASRVRRMILGEGGVLLATGLMLGLAGAFATARVLRGMLFGVTPNDPATFVAVALILGAVGASACWLPAARAGSVDPAIALRAE